MKQTNDRRLVGCLGVALTVMVALFAVNLVLARCSSGDSGPIEAIVLFLA
jgi:hypothetical protein